VPGICIPGAGVQTLHLIRNHEPQCRLDRQVLGLRRIGLRRTRGLSGLYDEVAAPAYGDPLYAAVHDLAFDTYCMQHPATYCRSAKSYAAHLTRLCCGLEYDGDREVYAAIQKWLNGKVDLQRPEVQSNLGQVTIADVRAARTGEEYMQRVRVWAENVWAAYAAQHDLAHTWIESALGHNRSASAKGSPRQR